MSREGIRPGAIALALMPALLLAPTLAGCVDARRTEVVDSSRLIVRGHLVALHGVDAPDSKHPKCGDEAKAAGFAQVRLGGLLKSGKDVDVRKTGMCLAFMSCDAVVTIDGEDLGELMVEQGYLAPKPGTAPGETRFNWCAADDAEPAPVMTPESPPPPEPPAALMNAAPKSRLAPGSG